MQIEKLSSSNAETLKQINNLYGQLSDKMQANPEELKAALENDNLHCLVAIEGDRVVGMGSLAVFSTLTTKRATVEDVVVDQEHRSQGIGRQIMQELLTIASQEGVKEVQLTSSPSRQAANNLYPSLGFRKKETNVYVLKL